MDRAADRALSSVRARSGLARSEACSVGLLSWPPVHKLPVGTGGDDDCDDSDDSDDGGSVAIVAIVAIMTMATVTIMDMEWKTSFS